MGFDQTTPPVELGFDLDHHLRTAKQMNNFRRGVDIRPPWALYHFGVFDEKRPEDLEKKHET